MAEKYLTVEITTPQKKRNFDQVVSCSAPGILGRFQILVNHTDFISQLGIGELKISFPDKTRYYALSGGFLEVQNNHVLLLLETFEAAEEVDIERAKQALDRAEKRISEKESGTDLERAKLALLRALNRLRVAEKVNL